MSDDLIKSTFESKAWAYVVMYHGVGIGFWDADEKKLVFHPSVEFDWEDVTELRVFDKDMELRFIRNEDGELKPRNSQGIKHDKLRCSDYMMYGTDVRENDTNDKSWTALIEDRGGKVYFPKDLKVASDIPMWLGIRNYLRFTEDLRLEVCDFAFTGFRKGSDKERVKL